MRAAPTGHSGPLRTPSLPIFVLLAAVWTAWPSSAKGDGVSAGEAAEPRFFIEAIDVEGTRHARPEVVVSESLLEGGRGYTEPELRDAVHRIRRLPFVLDARVRLRKGSERGNYRLLVTVDEAHRTFFGGDVVYHAFGDELDVDSGLDDELRTAATAGMRWFVGQGVVHAAVGDNSSPQVGYTRYRLFGRPGQLRITVAREDCCGERLLDSGLDPARGTWRSADSTTHAEWRSPSPSPATRRSSSAPR